MQNREQPVTPSRKARDKAMQKLESCQLRSKTLKYRHDKLGDLTFALGQSIKVSLLARKVS